MSYYNDAPCAAGASIGYQTPEQEAKSKREYIINQLCRAIENVAGIAAQLSGDARDAAVIAHDCLVDASDKFKGGC